MLRWDLSREFLHNRQMREGELGCRSGERAVFPLPLLQLRAFLEGGHPPPLPGSKGGWSAVLGGHQAEPRQLLLIPGAENYHLLFTHHSRLC